MTNEAPVLLLVEDDTNDILFFQRALRKTEPKIDLCYVTDGEQAIQYLRGEGKYQDRKKYPFPHVIVLDLKLPRRSGFEVLNWVKKQSRYSSMPVIIFTSSDQVHDIQQAYRIGANSYLVKPVGFENLYDLVNMVKRYWLQTNSYPSSSFAA